MGHEILYLALAEEGLKLISLATESPTFNAYAKRFVRSVEQEYVSNSLCLGKFCC